MKSAIQALITKYDAPSSHLELHDKLFEAGRERGMSDDTILDAIECTYSCDDDEATWERSYLSGVLFALINFKHPETS
jgi:hypothetical protein